MVADLGPSEDVSNAVQKNESPVIFAISKRLRNARKRLRGINDIQAKADAGQDLNSDQVSNYFKQVTMSRDLCIYSGVLKSAVAVFILHSMYMYQRQALHPRLSIFLNSLTAHF
jgi:hypothetical protein